jgi:ribulose-bisphosphate carboxylase large chain
VTPDEERLRISYLLTCVQEEPSRKAREIALEQTVELPERAVSRQILEQVAGRVEALEPAGGSRWHAVITYPLESIGADLEQLVNLLFGNISLQTGIRIMAVEWPAALLAWAPGPRLGIEGLRQICRVPEHRPLVCVALKPVGSSCAELADLCYRLALAGVDIVKDDHGLADQTFAPLRERLMRCQEAVSRANRASSVNAVYFPHLTADRLDLDGNLAAVRAAGCRGVLVSPLLLGLPTMWRLAATAQMALLAHPSLSGAFFGSDHGIAPEVLLGQVFRLIGSDGVIYPNAGGRFPFSEKTCRTIHRNLTCPLGEILPSFPVLAGGIDVARIRHWIELYGSDTVFLVGSSLYTQPDLYEATRGLVEAVRGYGNRGNGVRS